MGDGSEAEPEKEACNREEMLGRDQQRVVHEESCKEVDQKQELLVEDSAKLLMAVEHLPFPD